MRLALFFNRTIYVTIDGRATPEGNGQYWAF
jgi:hypothetical protein